MLAAWGAVRLMAVVRHSLGHKMEALNNQGGCWKKVGKLFETLVFDKINPFWLECFKSSTFDNTFSSDREHFCSFL